VELRENHYSSYRIQNSVQFWKLKSALVRTYADVESNHMPQMAAALSYYLTL
jgi:uncharacterized BrkB/YihY/UPF0761 family membrane protein